MKRLLLAVAVIGVLGFAVSAKADTVGTDTWRGETWDTLSDGASFAKIDGGSTLDFVANTGSGKRFAAYAAQDWGKHDFSENFSYAIKFDDNYSGTGENGFDFGLIHLVHNLDGSLTLTYSLQASFENYLDSTKHFRISIGDENDNTELFDFVSPVSEGWMGLKYDKTSHELNFSLFDNGGNFQVGNVIANANDPKYGSMNVFMVGSTKAEDIQPGTLKYTDFSENSTLPFNVTTPEPVSCVLFLLGGGAMGLRRYRRKSK